MPVLNAYSRFNERQADRYCFQSVRSVEPFVTAMNKLAEQNLANGTLKVGGAPVPFSSFDLEPRRRRPRLDAAAEGLGRAALALAALTKVQLAKFVEDAQP